MSKTSMDIHKADMSDEKQREALQVALLAVNMYTKGVNIANYIVKEFDRCYGGNWNCILGNPAYMVRYDPNNYIRFSVGVRKMTLFKSP